MKILNQLENKMEFETILAPYHELFADAIAIVYADDPKIIKSSLANPQDPDGAQLPDPERRALSDRDYSYLRDVSAWDRTEVHTMLTPSLAAWWQKITDPNPFAHLTKQEHIHNLYRNILFEIKSRTSDPDLWELSPQQVNERLIKRL